ncbi:uncharacterized protein [Henckelia pumila]|uniref:uncharacterized protein n=1 Tax=Henckelia pumila TaxID=405737 RepID=UPI003C6DFF12
MVNHVGNQNRTSNDPFSNTYNPGWKQHPNFSWGGQNNRPYRNQNYGKQHQEEKSSMEQMMQKFISSTETRMQNQDASIKNLENQIGQLAKAMSSREPGTLPSDTEKNSKEQVKAVELRSGKRIEPERQGEKEPESVILEKNAGKYSTSTQPPPSQSNIIVPPPFPAALKKVKLDSQFAKFLEVFKKLNINIPFADSLMQMPSYAKLLKEILYNKRKLEEHEMISITKNCSALVQNKIPPKQKDPGSFSIPCVINDVQFHKDMCDLGANINLMPYSVFRKLSLGEPKSTRMSLQLADRSIKYPRGIIEDVLVKVEKFILPVDFVVLDMEEDLDMPLILGRPFLATGKSLIGVQKGELLLKVGEEKISFDVFNALKFSQCNEECFQIDVVDSLLYDYVQDNFQESLEAALVSPPHDDEINEEIEEMTAYLNDNQSWRKGGKLRLEDLGDRKDLVLQKPSLEEPPTVELKPLPAHLKYVFLGENENLPVIFSSSLTGEKEARLLDVLKNHKSVFAWKVADIKGINPSICMHNILMEESINPLVQPQRRLNPKMQEVVKAETIKLLDAGIIYPISDSAWVSLVQCVPKKGGIIVIKNEQNDLIPTRTVIGWRVCIDYRKLNDATRKDHFPLPFIYQMLERLAGYEFYCFLDGYSRYNQIAIAPEDQDKTTFTCPYEYYFDEMQGDELGTNWEKCHFMVTEGIVLGHRISEQGIDVDRAKAFESLREKLVTAPVLTSPNWDLPFEVMCDASDSAVGAVLGQRIDKVFRTIYYASKTLNEDQLNYAITEKELLVVVFALDKFLSYLFLSKITVYTDHSAIRHLLAKKDAKSRLIRWILLLQEFDLEIKDKKRVENVVADHRSRLEFIPECAQNDIEDIDDWFPDEKLFAIENYPWYANFSNYVVTGKLPHNLFFHQKKKFLSDVKHYFWEEPFLFKICADSMIQRCVAEGEMKSILSHCHDREVGGYAGPIKTTAKLRLFLGKLKYRWSGPYKITRVYPSVAVELKDARNDSFTVNAQRQKHYVGGDVDSMPVITTLTDQD